MTSMEDDNVLELFSAGYHAALALVEAEIHRPSFQRLTYKELAVMLRMQHPHQFRSWQHVYSAFQAANG